MRALRRSPLDTLRAAATSLLPLPGLTGAGYARGHDLFEARSDQRALITGWLVDRVAHRAHAATRVLSVGAGDGSVDVAVAAALAAHGCPVRYDAVEPHAASARLWRDRMTLPGVRAEVQRTTYAAAALRPAYDVVLFVHSLYYVRDLRAAVGRARGLLAPGGEVIALLAPREELNALVTALAPERDGHPQWFSDQLAAVLGGTGSQGAGEVLGRLPARLDLTPTDDPERDARVLDFAVQAVLPAALRGPVRDYLASVRLPGPGLVVAHPVDALVVR